jgi:hypothetical protein
MTVAHSGAAREHRSTALTHPVVVRVCEQEPSGLERRALPGAIDRDAGLKRSVRSAFRHFSTVTCQGLLVEVLGGVVSVRRGEHKVRHRRLSGWVRPSPVTLGTVELELTRSG